MSNICEFCMTVHGQQDVQLEIATEQADLAGDEDKAIDLASRAVLRQRMAEEE